MKKALASREPLFQRRDEGKMEKEQGFKYLVDGAEEIGDFSKAILLLTNLKANNQGIVNFRTYYGSNNIRIITDTENDSYIASHIGEIKSKEECTIYTLVEDDFKEHVVKALEESDENDEEMHIEFDIL